MNMVDIRNAVIPSFSRIRHALGLSGQDWDVVALCNEDAIRLSVYDPTSACIISISDIERAMEMSALDDMILMKFKVVDAT